MTRRTMWWWVGGLLTAAVILVAVLAAINAGSDGTAGSSSATRLVLEGIPQAGTVLGRADAPVEVVEFADLQCPSCQRAASENLPPLVDKWVKPGTVRLRLAPLAFIGPDSVRGARAALAAGRQNVLWQFVDAVYTRQGAENSGWLSETLVRELAGQVGADSARLDVDRASNAIKGELDAAAASAQQAAVQSTPSFLVSGPNGQRLIVGVPSQSDLDTAIEAAR